MKTKMTNASVTDFLNNVKNDRRRQDSLVIKKMMQAISKKRAKMWGPSIIGFDKFQYSYANGGQGEICKIGFSPRAQALVFYGITQFKNRDKLFAKLGKHKFGNGGCLYINKLDDVDLKVLETIIDRAYKERNNHKNKK